MLWRGVGLYVLVCTTHITRTRTMYIYIQTSVRALKMPAASVCALPGAASSEAR